MDYYDPKLPYASNLTENFATSNGPSFAFMEISKISNESQIDWKSNWNQIDWFIHYSSNEISKNFSPNFFVEELHLLNPHIIIGMNLDKYYDDLFGADDTKYIRNFGENNQVAAYTVKTSMGDTFYLLDSFHFSAPNKQFNRDFVVPIMEGVKYFKDHYFNI